jgi:hypothetical protein
MKKLNKQLYLQPSALLILLVSACGDMKTVVKAPPLNIDPPVQAAGAQAAGEDPLAAQQKAVFDKIEMEKAWASAQGGSKRVVIGMLSTGVDYNHEDLMKNRYMNIKEDTSLGEVKKSAIDGKDTDGNGYVDDIMGWDVVDNDGYPYDTLGEGTSAVGILSATHGNGLGIKGMLKESTIVPVRYIDSKGTTSVTKLREGLAYLRSLASKPDIVLIQSASIVFDDNGMDDPASEKESLKQELEKWKSDQIPLVVSAGNRGSDISSLNNVVTELSKYSNIDVKFFEIGELISI